MVDAPDGDGTSPSINGRAQEGDTGTTSAKEMEASTILFTALYLEGSLRSARQGMLALRVMNPGASPDIPCDVIKSCILRNGNMAEDGHLSGGPRWPRPASRFSSDAGSTGMAPEWIAPQRRTISYPTDLFL